MHLFSYYFIWYLFVPNFSVLESILLCPVGGPDVEEGSWRSGCWLVAGLFTFFAIERVSSALSAPPSPSPAPATGGGGCSPPARDAHPDAATLSTSSSTAAEASTKTVRRQRTHSTHSADPSVAFGYENGGHSVMTSAWHWALYVCFHSTHILHLPLCIPEPHKSSDRRLLLNWQAISQLFVPRIL